MLLQRADYFKREMVCFFLLWYDFSQVQRVFVSRYSEDGAQQWVKDYTKDTQPIQAFDVYLCSVLLLVKHAASPKEYGERIAEFNAKRGTLGQERLGMIYCSPREPNQKEVVKMSMCATMQDIYLCLLGTIWKRVGWIYVITVMCGMLRAVEYGWYPSLQEQAWVLHCDALCVEQNYFELFWYVWFCPCFASFFVKQISYTYPTFNRICNVQIRKLSLNAEEAAAMSWPLDTFLCLYFAGLHSSMVSGSIGKVDDVLCCYIFILAWQCTGMLAN